MVERQDSQSTDKLLDKKLMYVSWAESCSRSDQTARELGGASYMVYLPIFGSHPMTIVPKYFGQFLMMTWLLARHRPHAVIIMSPPIVAVFAAVIYQVITRRRFAMDCHTAAFMHPRWRRFQWLQYAIARRACVNIVHNEHLRDLVESHGGKTIIVKDVPVLYGQDEQFDLPDGVNVTAVCSFNADEPIGEILDAARELPDVQFHLTGNPKHLSQELIDTLPENASLTGFISDSAFGDLLHRSNIVMSLTTRDHTMLRGAWEAIYQGTPVIVSDWPILKEAFPLGAIHVDNTGVAIAAAIRRCLENESDYSDQVLESRADRIVRWQGTRDQLLNALLN